MVWLTPHLFFELNVMSNGTSLGCPQLSQRCWAIQANTWTLCNAKIKSVNHGTFAPTYKGLNVYHSTNNVEHEFWHWKTPGSNCSTGRCFLIATGFLQLPHSQPLGGIFVCHHTQFLGLGRPCVCNLSTPTTNYKNKWKNVGLMDSYYMVEVIAIPYPGFEVLINIISKEDIAYQVTIGNIPHCTCPYFTKMSSHASRKKRKWVYCKHLYHLSRVMCKVDYESDKFIHV